MTGHTSPPLQLITRSWSVVSLMGQVVTLQGVVEREASSRMRSALSQLHEIKIETIDRFIIAGLIKLYNDLLVNHGPVKRKMLL